LSNYYSEKSYSVAKGGFDKSRIEPICPAIFGHSDYTECCQGELEVLVL